MIGILFYLASLPPVVNTLVIEDGIHFLIAKVERAILQLTTTSLWALDHAIFIKKRYILIKILRASHSANQYQLLTLEDFEDQIRSSSVQKNRPNEEDSVPRLQIYVYLTNSGIQNVRYK